MTDEVRTSYPTTKFPEWRRYQLDESSDYTVMISRLEMDAWFRRCMTSRPAITPAYKSKWTRGMTGDDTMNRYPIHPTHEDWGRWFKKWFSQFQSSPTSTKVDKE